MIDDKTSDIIRVLDVILSLCGLLLLSPLFIVLVVLCFFDTGSPFFKQQRLGRGKTRFVILKFRTMAVGTSDQPTHELDQDVVTFLGRFIRNLKLDELPQLLNVLAGDMSLVGPRPCLPSQHELIRLRCQRDIFSWRPGVTGLAQIRRVDMSEPKKLVDLEVDMMANLNLKRYATFLIMTLIGRGCGDSLG